MALVPFFEDAIGPDSTDTRAIYLFINCPSPIPVQSTVPTRSRFAFNSDSVVHSLTRTVPGTARRDSKRTGHGLNQNGNLLAASCVACCVGRRQEKRTDGHRQNTRLNGSVRGRPVGRSMSHVHLGPAARQTFNNPLNMA